MWLDLLWSSESCCSVVDVVCSDVTRFAVWGFLDYPTVAVWLMEVLVVQLRFWRDVKVVAFGWRKGPRHRFPLACILVC